MGADPATLDTMADVILNAKHPVILVDFIGRQPGNFEKLVTLAETLGCGVWDINNSLAFPNQHPLCISLDHESLKKADVILGIDGVTGKTNPQAGLYHPRGDLLRPRRLRLDGDWVRRARDVRLGVRLRSVSAKETRRPGRPSARDARS